jgi:hypothetical protein
MFNHYHLFPTVPSAEARADFMRFGPLPFETTFAGLRLAI